MPLLQTTFGLIFGYIAIDRVFFEWEMMGPLGSEKIRHG